MPRYSTSIVLDNDFLHFTSSSSGIVNDAKDYAIETMKPHSIDIDLPGDAASICSSHDRYLRNHTRTGSHTDDTLR